MSCCGWASRQHRTPASPATYELRSSLEKVSPLFTRVSNSLTFCENGLEACRMRWCREMLLGWEAESLNPCPVSRTHPRTDRQKAHT